MPWHLPSDLKFFRKLTYGKAVVFGHRTFQSIGRPLRGRLNILLTRNAALSIEGVHCVTGLEEALDLARAYACEQESQEIAVVGGGEIYDLTLPLTDRIHLTVIKDRALIEGDTFYRGVFQLGRTDLDGILRDQWREVERKDVPRVGGEEYDRVYAKLERLR